MLMLLLHHDSDATPLKSHTISGWEEIKRRRVKSHQLDAWKIKNMEKFPQEEMYRPTKIFLD